MNKKYPYGEGIVRWVSTEWLEGHLGDRDLMILDVQPNAHDYIQEHIPGAVYLNEGLLRAPSRGVPAQYVPKEVPQALLRRVGLKADIPVVVYTGVGPYKGWGDGLEQTMMAYALARFGHNHVYVLDGGIEKWNAEDRPLAQEYAKVEESNFGAQVRSDYFVEYEAFKAMKDREDVMLLDARPPEVYQGQGPWMKAGHIPGAINVPWKRFMDPDNARLLRPDDEIQAVLDEHDITSDKTVICSCGTGREGWENLTVVLGGLGGWNSVSCPLE